MNEQNSQFQILQIQDDSSEDNTDLKAYILSLIRRWWVIAIVFIFSLAIAFARIHTSAKLYESATTLKMPTPSGSSGTIASILGGLLPVGISSDIATEMEILKGKEIAENALKELKFDKESRNANLTPRQILMRFQSRVKITKKGQTNLIEVRAVGRSASESANIANTVAEEYIKKTKATTQEIWTNLINQMASKLEETKKELENSRQLLHDYEAKEGISTAFSPLLLGGGMSERAGSQYMIPDVPQLVATLKANITQMEIRLEFLRKHLPEANPEVIELKTQIAQTKQKLSEEESKAIAKYNKQFGLSTLAAKVLFNQQMLTQVVSKHEELKAQYIMQFKSPEIIEKAVEPLFPSRPRKTMMVMLGGAVGIFLGVCFAIVLEYLDDSIRTPNDVRKKTEFPTIGRIPVLKSRNQSPLLIYKDRNRTNKESWRKRLYRESFISLRTEILSLITTENDESESAKGKAILVTSPDMREGKSLVSLNLAISLAEANMKTLIIDADPRHSGQRMMSGVSPNAGLSDYLREKASWDDIINSTQINNLSIIISQTIDSEYDLSDLLFSNSMSVFMQKAREAFDFIIFDSTPITLSSESTAIGSMVDFIILVLRSRRSKGASLAKALQIMKNGNMSEPGIVMTCLKPERRYRKYYKQFSAISY